MLRRGSFAEEILFWVMLPFIVLAVAGWKWPRLAQGRNAKFWADEYDGLPPTGVL